MHAPLHRSINKKGALALSFSAFLVPVLFVVFVEAFLLPTSVRNSQLAYHEDMSSALHQAVYNAPGSRIVARDTTPKLGYMLGRRDLVARQDSESPEDRPNADDETTSTRPRSTSRTTSRATRTNDDEDERSTSTRRPTATARKNDAPKQTSDNKPKIVYACAWSRMIEGTNTTPLWLTLGLSAGSVAGILIAAFTAYQYGKAHKGAAGGGGGGGMGGPPMY